MVIPPVIADVGRIVVFTLLGLAGAYGLWRSARVAFGLGRFLATLWRNRRVERKSRVVGTVVGHHQEGMGQQLVYHPEIQYRIPDGREFRHRSGERRSHEWPPVGTEAELAYDPANPSDAVVIKFLLKPAPPHPSVRKHGKLP